MRSLNLEKANDDYYQYFREFKLELGLVNQSEEEFILSVMDFPKAWEISEEEALKKSHGK